MGLWQSCELREKLIVGQQVNALLNAGMVRLPRTSGHLRSGRFQFAIHHGRHQGAVIEHGNRLEKEQGYPLCTERAWIGRQVGVR